MTSPDVVYFAGRGDALVKFVEVLSARRCKDTPINIVTGDDIAGLLTRAKEGGNGVNAARKPFAVLSLSADGSSTLVRTAVSTGRLPGGS